MMVTPSQHTAIHRRHCRRGYVLLTALLLLALAASAMTAAALRSFRSAVESARATEALQVRWGTLSCQAALLPRAEQVLARAEERSQEPAAEVRLTLRLNGRDWDVVVTDEQAKANLNAAFARGREPEAERVARALLARSVTPLSVRLRPTLLPTAATAAAARGGRPPRVFDSYGQVFDAPAPRDLTAADPLSGPPTADLTCWGSGRVNVRRASTEALEQACTPWLAGDGAARLVQLRGESPGAGLAALLDRMELDRERRAALEQRLCDGSACHGIWVLARTADRTYYRWAVSDAAAGTGAVPRVSTFDW